MLERPYHLSYPFLIDMGGELYMTSPRRLKIAAWSCTRCTHFPNQWQFVRNLLENVYAVDANLFGALRKYWLFANEKVPGGSSLDALHLYFGR